MIFTGKIDTRDYLAHVNDQGWPLKGLNTSGSVVRVPSGSKYAMYDNCCQTFQKYNDPVANSVYCFGVFGRHNTADMYDVNVSGGATATVQGDINSGRTIHGGINATGEGTHICFGCSSLIILL